MPGIDEVLRAEGERWRAEIDAHHMTTTVPAAPPSPRPWSTTRGRVWAVSVAGIAAAAVVVLAVGLATSPGDSGSSGSSAASPLRADAKAAAPAAAEGSGGVSSTSGGKATSAPAAAPVGSTSLILNGSVAVTVTTNGAVDRAATLATDIADGAGGRVDSDARSAGAQHSATLVLRVPNAALPGVTRRLATLGTIRSQNLQTRDVTAQVADVNSRVTSARAAIAALTRLYAEARSVSELIAVESALSSRQSDLEALEAQQRTLSAQTSLATLTVSVDVQAPRVAHQAHGSGGGFVGGLHGGWRVFTRGLHALATGVGAAVPFLVVALVLAAAGLVAARRRRPRRSLADPKG